MNSDIAHVVLYYYLNKIFLIIKSFVILSTLWCFLSNGDNFML